MARFEYTSQSKVKWKMLSWKQRKDYIRILRTILLILVLPLPLSCVLIETGNFPRFTSGSDNLEESFEFEDDFVTLAPFHPDWQFGDGPPELDIEKQSPYPTVTIVCTSVIDKAGAAATKAIGEHNERVLLDMGVSKLRELYQTSVFHKDSPS